jgi:hypothetical protein
MCRRSTYKLTWEEIVAFSRLVAGFAEKTAALSTNALGRAKQRQW